MATPAGCGPLEVVGEDRLGAAEGLAVVGRVGQQQQAVVAPEPCSCSAPPSASAFPIDAASSPAVWWSC